MFAEPVLYSNVDIMIEAAIDVCIATATPGFFVAFIHGITTGWSPLFCLLLFCIFILSTLVFVSGLAIPVYYVLDGKEFVPFWRRRTRGPVKSQDEKSKFE